MRIVRGKAKTGTSADLRFQRVDNTLALKRGEESGTKLRRLHFFLNRTTTAVFASLKLFEAKTSFIKVLGFMTSETNGDSIRLFLHFFFVFLFCFSTTNATKHPLTSRRKKEGKRSIPSKREEITFAPPTILVHWNQKGVRVHQLTGVKMFVLKRMIFPLFCFFILAGVCLITLIRYDRFSHPTHLFGKSSPEIVLLPCCVSKEEKLRESPF